MSSALPAYKAKFTEGSMFRHVVEMTLTGAVGLIAIFFVDFLSLLYVSWLNSAALTAGVGYATTVLFLSISINVGTMIAISALVSRALGAGKREYARRLAASTLSIAAACGLLVTLILLAFLDIILRNIGADGQAYVVAKRFLWITLPSNALMSIGMGLSGILRAAGDARRAMSVTLIGGAIIAVLDPVLIFGLKLGTDGAAISTVISRFLWVYVGARNVWRHHRLIEWPTLSHIRQDARATIGIAGPAILTNIAAPVANAFIMAVLARFGDAVVAGGTILDRLTPLAFGTLFALTGAIGPIFGQNYGAKRYDRLIMGLRDATVFALIYVTIVWLILVLARHQIAYLFSAVGATADYVTFFCLISGPMWGFVGALFVANTAFNNLGFPLYSTFFNWGRATLGTIPFAMVGAALGGPAGVLIGITIGAAIFGTVGLIVAFWKIRRLPLQAEIAAGAGPS